MLESRRFRVLDREQAYVQEEERKIGICYIGDVNHIYPSTISPNAIRARIAIPIIFFLHAKEAPANKASIRYTIINLTVKPILHLLSNSDLSG